ncbi:hypothetical protein [Pseudorhodoplanes sp.]|uniref:hypothetical protein n=1 Tax=Pseudorhodoplanes sp. TaxID=1934341 RepID=UPI00391BEAA8
MIRTLVIATSAAFFAASAAQAQNAPPPGNVNPGSMQSGQEQTGAPNQPRSLNQGAIQGTTGSGIPAPQNPADADRDGVNANVKPSSPDAGAEPAGQPAGERRQ